MDNKDFPTFIAYLSTLEFNADLGKLLVGGSMTSKAPEIFNKNFAVATEGIAEEYIEKQLKVLDTLKIDFGSSCSTCSKPLIDKNAQYLSHQDKAYFGKACGEHEDPTKIGVEKSVNPSCSHVSSYEGSFSRRRSI